MKADRELAVAARVIGKMEDGYIGETAHRCRLYRIHNVSFGTIALRVRIPLAHLWNPHLDDFLVAAQTEFAGLKYPGEGVVGIRSRFGSTILTLGDPVPSRSTGKVPEYLRNCARY